MDAASHPRLLADVGGTNARFGWQAAPGEPIVDVATYPSAGIPTLEAAMRHYLADHGKPAPRCGAVGIASAVLGDRVQMTNHHWSFSVEAVRRDLGLERLIVINDFTALALALPGLTRADLAQIGGGAAAADAAVALIGPGTGLGVSGLVRSPDGRRMIPLAGEGGHVTLAGADAAEDAVIALLRARFGHASAERALSGPGLVNLYRAVCERDGLAARELDAADVAADTADAACVEAVQLFFSLLGGVAGNLALTLGARGGVYLGGGILPRLHDRLPASAFRERFEAKGRFRDYLAPIPVYLIKAQTSPALVGAAKALDWL